jgi:polyisoprenyl-phosphate glycosyltransferase
MSTTTQIGANSTREECFVSVACALRDGTIDLERYMVELSEHLEKRFADHEILLVHLGVDRDLVLNATEILSRVPNVRFIELAPGIEDDVVRSVCLENAIGDFVVILDPCSDPVDVVSALVDRCRGGSDVVVGVTRHPATLGYRMAAPFMRRLLGKVGYNLPRDVTGLCCLSRLAVSSVLRIGRSHHEFTIRIGRSGFPVFSLEYEPKAKIHRTLVTGLRTAMRVLIFNSRSPLRWIVGVGMFGSLLCSVASGYSILVHFVRDHVQEGWTTMMVLISGLFMLQFAILALLGEYVGHLLEEFSRTDAYSVVFEKHSSVMLDQERRNVKTELGPESVMAPPDQIDSESPEA